MKAITFYPLIKKHTVYKNVPKEIETLEGILQSPGAYDK